MVLRPSWTCKWSNVVKIPYPGLCQFSKYSFFLSACSFRILNLSSFECCKWKLHDPHDVSTYPEAQLPLALPPLFWHSLLVKHVPFLSESWEAHPSFGKVTMENSENTKKNKVFWIFFNYKWIWLQQTNRFIFSIKILISWHALIP